LLDHYAEIFAFLMNLGAGSIGIAIAIYSIVVAILADRWMTFEEQLTALRRKMTKDLQGIGPEDYDKAVTVVKQAEADSRELIRIRFDFSPKNLVILPCALFVGGILSAMIGMVNSSCSTSWLCAIFSVAFLIAGFWKPIHALSDIHKMATGWIPTVGPDQRVSKPIIAPPYEAPQGVGPVPTVLAQIQQRDFILPRVGFALSNFNKFPLKARVKATVYLGTRGLGIVPPDPHGYYSGKVIWNLNAETAIFGNFAVHSECVSSSETLRIQVEVTVTDLQSREHKLLPVCYTYVRESNSWYLEPTGIDGLTGNSGNQ
jgi:hypothetical protein